jgi:hypothetical protein
MNFIVKFWLESFLQAISPRYIGLGANPTAGAFKNLANSDASTSGMYGGQAASEGGQLNPFFSQEMRAQHGYTPGQTGELLTAAEGGAGGAFGGAEGQMNANAARTGNSTTLTKSLDEMARDKAKVAAGASEGIAAQDVAGAKQLNQEGAAGMQGLYGTNVKGQLDSMGLQNEALKNEQSAIGPGFLQKAIGDLGTLSNVAGTAMAGYKMAQ